MSDTTIQARATLVGAQVGLSRILQRFIDGLKDSAILRELAARLAESVDSPV